MGKILTSVEVLGESHLHQEHDIEDDVSVAARLQDHIRKHVVNFFVLLPIELVGLPNLAIFNIEQLPTGLT